MRLGGLCTLQSRINIKIIGRTRGYRLPAGTYPAVDSRSIYDTRVHYLWHPQSWFNTEERARLALRRAAAKAFEIEDADKLVEACLKSFFVPYWMARVALYWPIDHATTKRQYTEGRIAISLTFPLSGSSNPALKTLHFLEPTTEPMELQGSSTLPVDNFINVPFSEPPPLHWKAFFQTMYEDRHLMLSRNLRLRPREAQCQIAARPLLEPIVLGEYTYNGQRLTAAYCPRSVDPDTTPDIRIFRRGKWTHETEAVGPLHIGMNIAWSGDDPLGVDEGRYKFLETFLGNQSRLWMRDAAKAGGTTELSSSLWNSVAVGKEGFESVHAWQKAKVHLYNEGHELSR